MSDLSLSYLASILLKRLWIIILALVICAGAAFSYCVFLATPVYKSLGSIIVTNGGVGINVIVPEDTSDSITTSDISASLNLIDTCVDILSSPGIYKELSSMYPKYSYRELQDAFNVKEKKSGSMFINITFENSNSSDTENILKSFMEICPRYITDVLHQTEVTPMENADTVSQISPRKGYTTLFAGIIGAILTAVIIVIIDLSDQAIKSEEDFVKLFNVPLLGTVPDFETTNSSDKGYSYGKY